MPENLEDAYRHYRHTAAYTTTTVIVFSAVILGWAAQKPGSFIPVDGAGKIALFVLGLIPMFIAILSGVYMQFLIFKGYLKEARNLFARESQKEPESGNSNIDFGRADCLVSICVGAFILGFLTIAVFISISYFS